VPIPRPFYSLCFCSPTLYPQVFVPSSLTFPLFRCFFSRLVQEGAFLPLWVPLRSFVFQPFNWNSVELPKPNVDHHQKQIIDSEVGRLSSPPFIFSVYLACLYRFLPKSRSNFFVYPEMAFFSGSRAIHLTDLGSGTDSLPFSYYQGSIAVSPNFSTFFR